MKLVLIGGGEHARVVLDAARAAGVAIAGCVDVKLTQAMSALDVLWLGDDDAALRSAEVNTWHFIAAVGSSAAAGAREQLALRYAAHGVSWATVVHPRAIVSAAAVLEGGVVVLAGAIVNSGACVRAHAIVNSGAIIEHDVDVGEFAHVAPGVTIGGGSSIGRNAHIGLGATIRDHVRIGDGAVVGMGAVVIASVAAGAIVAGVPARPLR